MAMNDDDDDDDDDDGDFNCIGLNIPTITSN